MRTAAIVNKRIRFRAAGSGAVAQAAALADEDESCVSLGVTGFRGLELGNGTENRENQVCRLLVHFPTTAQKISESSARDEGCT